MNLAYFIAKRHIRRQQGAFSSFIIRISVVATTVSVAVMLLSTAFITGFKESISDKLYSFWGHMLIVPYNPNPTSIISPKPIDYDSSLVKEIRNLPGVKSVAPFVLRPVIIQAHGKMEGVKMKGIDKDYPFSPNLNVAGTPVDFSDTLYSRQIVLSQSTMNKLDIKRGDWVFLYFLEAGGTVPSIRKVQVSMQYHTGMEDLDNYFAFCDIRMLQRINQWTPGNINGYQVDLRSDKDVDVTARHIFDHFIEPPLTTETIKDTYPGIFDWLNIQNINGIIILVIMSIVAIINLSVGLIILIVDQMKTVGILKTLGMSDREIQKTFTIKATFIAVIGIVLGNMLTFAICYCQLKFGFLKLPEETYFLKQVPVKLYWWQLAAINLGTLLICFLCMWLPSRYVRRIHPVKVLQFK